MIAILFVGFSVLFTSQMTVQAQTPNVTIVLYENEFGFSFSIPSGPLTGGPTLNLANGDVVNVTVFNMGTTQHGWEIIASYPDNTTVLFNALIPSINPGASANVTFTVTQTGAFNYVCPIDGHAGFGMVGSVDVAIPEFSNIALVTLLMAFTLLVAAAKGKIKR